MRKRYSWHRDLQPAPRGRGRMILGVCSLCIAVLIGLVVLDSVKPTWFRIDSETSYQVVLYAPGSVGSVTILLWRGTFKSYNIIIPYVRMADGSNTCPQKKQRRHDSHRILAMPLASLDKDEFSLGQIFHLWKGQDYLSCLVNTSSLAVILLLYTGSSVFELVEGKNSSWWIHVNFGFAVAAICHYLFLAIVTVCIIRHLRKRRTGLKWSPTTLAAQLALIQGSNILDKFTETDDAGSIDLEHEVTTWPQRPHLGYWEENGSNRIVYGVRIIRINGRDQASSSRMPKQEVESVPKVETAAPEPQPEVTKTTNQPPSSMSLQSYRELCHVPCVVVLGAGLILAATVFWARGDIYEPFRVKALTGTILEAVVVSSFLPYLIFDMFHNLIISHDMSNCTNAPIVNMAGPLDREERERLYHDKEDRGVLGATALRSVLLDYVDPNPVTGIFSALRSSDFKVAFGTLLALVSAVVYTFLGQLFYLPDYEIGSDGYYHMAVSPHLFYAFYVILIVYCFSIWLLRPRDLVHPSRPVLTLLDLALLVRHSHILQCPEFSVPPEQGEQRLRAQVLLADRVYRFGRLRGVDGEDHIGISPAEVPEAWIRAAADPVTPRASAAVRVASRALKDGFYGDQDLAAGLQDASGRATPKAIKVVDDEEEYVSLRPKAKKWWLRRKENKAATSEV
ncbi:hypothetical protein RB595_002278 [Gaeumannomyces hyphopodioides]